MVLLQQTSMTTKNKRCVSCQQKKTQVDSNGICQLCREAEMADWIQAFDETAESLTEKYMREELYEN